MKIHGKALKMKQNKTKTNEKCCGLPHLKFQNIENDTAIQNFQIDISFL